MKRVIILIAVILAAVAVSAGLQAQTVVKNYEWTPGTEAPMMGKMNLPFNDLYLAGRRCKLLQPTKIQNRNYYIVFASLGHANDNAVEDVYLIPEGLKNSVSYRNPPTVVILKYHNLGGNGESPDFCSVVREFSTPNDDGTFSRVVTNDRIDDECANLLIDLLTGSGKYRYECNSSGYDCIDIVETTDPRLSKLIIY